MNPMSNNPVTTKKQTKVMPTSVTEEYDEAK